MPRKNPIALSDPPQGTQFLRVLLFGLFFGTVVSVGTTCLADWSIRNFTFSDPIVAGLIGGVLWVTGEIIKERSDRKRVSKKTWIEGPDGGLMRGFLVGLSAGAIIGVTSGIIRFGYLQSPGFRVEVDDAGVAAFIGGVLKVALSVFKRIKK